MPVTNTPLVSVVMPVFNNCDYIEGAILSVINQSFSDFELIIVDDGSVDGSRDVEATYALRDRRVRIVYQEHAGVVSALNLGCSLAKGKYIARLDSDDLSTPQRLAQQVVAMETGCSVLLGGSIECIDGKGATLFAIRFPNWNEGLRDRLLVNCYMAHTTVMFRKDIFLAMGGYRSHFEDAEDYDLFLRMSDHHMVDNLPTVLSHYRLHEGQVSVQKASQQIISSIGARLAAWARRSICDEPKWLGNVITREDLISFGVKNERIDALVSAHRKAGISVLAEWSASGRHPSSF